MTRLVPRSTTLTFTLTNRVSTRITSSSETSSGPGRAGVPTGGFLGSGPINSGGWAAAGFSRGVLFTGLFGREALSTTGDELLDKLLTSMLPAAETSRTLLAFGPRAVLKRGRCDPKEEVMFPVCESAKIFALADSGTSTRISPERV